MEASKQKFTSGALLAEHHSIQLLPLMFGETFALPALSGAGPTGGITKIISAPGESLTNGGSSEEEEEGQT